MSIKNAIKILISRFSLVFSILLFITIFGFILVSLSLPLTIPILSILKKEGLFDVLSNLFSLETFSLKQLSDSVGEIFTIIKSVFASNTRFAVDSALFIGLIVIFAYRFLIGYYELPLTEVLSAKMSYNARLGFLGKFISNLKLSSRFIVAKMTYTLLIDIVINLILFQILSLWGIHKLLTLALPFILISAFVVLNALRYTLISAWAPMVSGGGKIFASFKGSLRLTKQHFLKIFGSYIFTWVIIIVINGLVGLITFGAGLLITAPMSMVFICVLNLTLYYENSGMKYYIDDVNSYKPHENKPAASSPQE